MIHFMKNQISSLPYPDLMPCDEYWPKLRLIMYQQNIDDKENLRLTAGRHSLSNVCLRPWRDLPRYFGCCNSEPLRQHIEPKHMIPVRPGKTNSRTGTHNGLDTIQVSASG